MTNFDRITSFLLVANEGSFAKAAKILGLSVAAVSKQVSSLEKEYSVELFTRTTRSIRLTEIGAIFYEQFSRLTEDFNEVQSQLKDIQRKPEGKLKVFCNPHFAELYIIPFLQEFYELYPGILLDLDLQERIPDLEKENIDVLIGMSLSGPENSIQRKIADTRYVTCASPKYLKKHGTPEKAENLADHNYLNHSMRRPITKVQFSNGCEVFVRPILLTNSIRALVATAVNGIGIIRVHEYAVKHEIDNGSLVPILTQYDTDTVPIYVCYKKTQYLTSKIRCFIDFTLEKLCVRKKNV